VLEQAPGLDDAFADELARKLHAAWPKLSPERAAACFFAPAISAAESYAVELA
jgi:retron-type reverse transcriptase